MKFLRQLQGLPDNEDSNFKMGAIELWKRVFLDSVKKSDSTYPKLRDYNFYSNGSATFSGKDNIALYFTIDGYPSELSNYYRSSIRQEAVGGIRISFISTFENTSIDWGSAQMKSKLKTWKQIDEDSEDVNEYNLRENIAKMDSTTRRKESLVYLSDAEVRRKRRLFKYRTLMVISGKRGSTFDTTIKNVLDYCRNTGLKITWVTGDVEDYLKAFSPFSLEFNSDVLKNVGNNTIPDELLARFSSYDQGKVGKSGMYWGTDIYSGFPVFKETKKSDVDAENILITAETGGGKSYFIKALLLQFLADNRFKGTIMDIEGDEYLPLAGFVANKDSVIIINMAEGQGCYYDPVEIVTTGDDELDKDMFSFSKSFTLSIFKTLLGRTLEENEWASIIVDKSVAYTYASSGVSYDKETWHMSKGLTLFDVYENIKNQYKEIQEEIQSGADYELTEMFKKNPDYKKALDLVIAKLSAYFEPLENGGTKSDVFQDKVSLNEIKNAKLVVCSFGMKGKSAKTVDPIQMALSQLSAATITHMRSIFSQAQGLFNFKVWEEFQRWGAFPDSDVTIKTALTGGRKLGDVNMIVTNDVKELLNTDRFGIFGNTTSFAIGAIDDADTRERLCQRLTIPLLKSDLDKLVTKKGNTESFAKDEEITSIYDKAFLVRLDKSVSTITKMMLPDHIARSSIFRTGVKGQQKKKKVEDDIAEY